MTSHPHLKVAISDMSVDERLQLAQALWDSIESSDNLPLTTAQAQVLDQRLEQQQQDPAAGSDWSVVKQRLMNE